MSEYDRLKAQYDAILSRKRIRAIRTDDDLSAALARIDKLMDAAAGTAEGDELNVLTDLVAHYEHICAHSAPPKIHTQDCEYWTCKRTHEHLDCCTCVDRTKAPGRKCAFLDCVKPEHAIAPPTVARESARPTEPVGRCEGCGEWVTPDPALGNGHDNGKLEMCGPITGFAPEPPTVARETEEPRCDQITIGKNGERLRCVKESDHSGGHVWVQPSSPSPCGPCNDGNVAKPGPNGYLWHEWDGEDPEPCMAEAECGGCQNASVAAQAFAAVNRVARETEKPRAKPRFVPDRCGYCFHRYDKHVNDACPDLPYAAAPAAPEKPEDAE